MIKRELLENITKYFSNLPVEKIFLFGSYARKEQNEESDIDLIIQFERNAKITLMQFSRMKIDIEKILNHEVDLLTENAISPYILPFIQKDMQKIYEKTN